jgi:sugar phosphate permease
MWYVIGGIVFFVIGFVVSFFVMRNNPKYFGIDKMLKTERDQLLSLGKAKLEALKQKIEDALK